MAGKTTNYELTKPTDNENADIAVINENMDKIDTALGDKADKTATNTALEKKTDKPTVLTGTLAAKATSLALSNAEIKTSSIIDIYTDKYGVSPTAVDVAAGKITMTFDAQTVAIGIRVEVR